MKVGATRHAHLALVAQQSIFGVSTVLYKLALPGMNPLTLCFIREVGAGCVLLLAATLQELLSRRRPDSPVSAPCSLPLLPDGAEAGIAAPAGVVASPAEKSTFCLVLRLSPLLFAAAFFLWLGQLATLLGMKLYGPSAATAAAAWHPTEPLWTVFFAVFLLRLERATWPKLLGIFLGVCGGLWMASWEWLLGVMRSGMLDESVPSPAASPSSAHMLGTGLFITNAVASSLFIIVVRAIHARLASHCPLRSSLTVIACVYVLCASLTFPLVLWINSHGTGGALWLDGRCLDQGSECPPAAYLLRTLCQGELDCMREPWRIPRGLTVAFCIAWIACVHAGFATFLQGWALKHVHASVAAFYTVLQPAVSAALVLLLLGLRLNPLTVDASDHPIFQAPSWISLLGVAPIAVGLLCIVREALSEA